MMDSYSSSLGTPFPWEEPVTQGRDNDQMSTENRIPPPQEPDPSKAFRLPSPLEPDTTFLNEPNVPRPQPVRDNSPMELPALSEFLNAANSDMSMPSLDCPETSGPGLGESVPRLSAAGNHQEAGRKGDLPSIDIQPAENSPNLLDDETPFKRARLDGERLQLPTPRIQTEQACRPFGPVSILNGLNEPPPNAPLFPPIETDSSPTFLERPRRNHARVEAPPTCPPVKGQGTRDITERKDAPLGSSIPIATTYAQEYLFGGPDYDEKGVVVAQQKPEPKKKGQKGPKKYRRWTEEETFELMRGISRCGVGHWTAILSQPDLKFNNRSAVNIKDRFRVCCPWAYETEAKMGAAEVNKRVTEFVSEAGCGATAKHASSSSGKTEMSEVAASASETASPDNSSESTEPGATISPVSSQPLPINSKTKGKQKTKPRKKNNGTKGSAALSQRSQSALVSLGLNDPLTNIKSTRLRRTFSKEEDDNLFKGYLKHGFHWSAIQNDPQFKFDGRKPTVLRDRFRFRYPETYRRGGLQGIKYMYPLQGSPFAAEMMFAAEQSQAGQPQQGVPAAAAPQPISWVAPGGADIPTRGANPNDFPPSNTLPSDTQTPPQVSRAPPLSVAGRSGLIYPVYPPGFARSRPDPPQAPGLSGSCDRPIPPDPNLNCSPDNPPTRPSEISGGTTNSPQPIFPFSDDDAPQQTPMGDPMDEDDNDYDSDGHDGDDGRWTDRPIPPFLGDFTE